MELVEMLPLDLDNESEVYAIALVDNPAIRASYIYLSADEKEVRENKRVQQIKLNEEKRMLYTPVLIPDLKIPRVKKVNGKDVEYNIVWKKNSIETIAQNFLSKGQHVRNWNNEHRSWDKLEGISVVESWVKEDEQHDKSVKLGLDYPVGTWFVGIKLYSDDVVADVKAGRWKGISLEGNFLESAVSLSSQSQNKNVNPINNSKSTNLNLMNKHLKKVSELLKSASDTLAGTNTKLGSTEIDGGGSLYFEGESLEMGAMVYSDEAMESPASDNTYVLADGREVVVAEGIVQSVNDAPSATEDEVTSEQLAGSMEEFGEVVSALAEAVAKLEARMVEIEKAMGSTTTEEAVVEMRKQTKKLSAEIAELKKRPAVKSVKEVSLMEDENSSLSKFAENRVL